MQYITGKQAQQILSITTRQGLAKIVKANNIETKSQGAGKPNLYNKSDIENYIKNNKKNIEKYKPKATIKKVEKKTKQIIEKKEVQTKKKKTGLLNDNPLNEVGQEVFNTLLEELVENGTFQDKDISLLQAYCVSYQKYINAINQSAEQMDTFMDDFGNVKIHPYFSIADKCLSQMDKLSKALGMGARNRIGLEIKEKKTAGIMDILAKEEKF